MGIVRFCRATTLTFETAGSGISAPEIFRFSDTEFSLPNGLALEPCDSNNLNSSAMLVAVVRVRCKLPGWLALVCPADWNKVAASSGEISCAFSGESRRAIAPRGLHLPGFGDCQRDFGHQYLSERQGFMRVRRNKPDQFCFRVPLQQTFQTGLHIRAAMGSWHPTVAISPAETLKCLKSLF